MSNLMANFLSNLILIHTTWIVTSLWPSISEGLFIWNQCMYWTMPHEFRVDFNCYGSLYHIWSDTYAWYIYAYSYLAWHRVTWIILRKLKVVWISKVLMLQTNQYIRRLHLIKNQGWEGLLAKKIWGHMMVTL